MFPLAETRDPAAVQAVVQRLYLECFPKADPGFVPRIFGWALAAFTGRYRDYQPIDARYHDLEHTMQGTLCLAQLLRGRHFAAAQPAVSQRLFELGMVGILLHDTGYLKVRGDNEGTGAKYTLIHVSRSADFARQLLTENGYSSRDIGSVQRMIHCTGVRVKQDAIDFQSEAERKVGYSLGTADLLGQMAALDYVDKLPILFLEFEESARHNGVKLDFANAEDLVRRTTDFWSKYVFPKLEKVFQSQFRYLNDPLPDGSNPYLERVEANVAEVSRVPPVRALKRT